VGRLHIAQPPHIGGPNGVFDGAFAAQFEVGGLVRSANRIIKPDTAEF
jgi:hypothetical protein